VLEALVKGVSVCRVGCLRCRGPKKKNTFLGRCEFARPEFLISMRTVRCGCRPALLSTPSIKSSSDSSAQACTCTSFSHLLVAPLLIPFRFSPPPLPLLLCLRLHSGSSPLRQHLQKRRPRKRVRTRLCGDYVFLRGLGLGLVEGRASGAGAGDIQPKRTSGIEETARPNMGLGGDMCGRKARFAVRTEFENTCEDVGLDVGLENV
jgi:hypothetical protein